VDFGITEQQRRLQQKCLDLAADFATRSADHDRDASHPVENYNRLREDGFMKLTIDGSFGGLMRRWGRAVRLRRWRSTCMPRW